MLDNSVCAGTGVLAGAVYFTGTAASLCQEIGELIMFDDGKVEMRLIAVPLSADDVVLEFCVPVTAGKRTLVANVKAPSRDVEIVIGEVAISEDQTARMSLKAVPACPVILYAF